MKKFSFYTLLIVSVASSFLNGCKKWAVEKLDLAVPVVQAAQPISDAAPLCKSIKGTMLSGKTYTIGCVWSSTPAIP